MISRKRAVEVATDVVGTMGRTLSEVRDLADPARQGVRAPCVYNLDLSNSWIAYLAPPPGRFGLFSSDIVVIDKATGAVGYAGSANDEA